MESQTPNQTPPAPPTGQKPKILLVEDDTLLIKMYKTKFEMEGFEILVAQDGESGLQIALNSDIDFIILDVMLPKISGLDLLEKLRQDPRKKDLKVIFLSNLNNPQDAQKAFNLGAKEYLLKSNLTPSEIVKKVHQYLNV